jgi:chorismate mutase / prephenate dehydratase
MMKKVAYQGTQASFSEIAIDRFFGNDAIAIGKMTFQDVFESLERKEVELAAVPIENSLIGPIAENFDLFHRFEVTIVGELCLPIEHCLVGQHGQKIDAITKVFSHPKALAQCTSFFQEHPWIEPVVHFDTAGAAREIAQRIDPTLAAIGSRKTAEIYALDILKANLEDDRTNTTRFLFLRKCSTEHFNEGKCSLLFTAKHTPGALAQVLQILAHHQLNLTQVVSRPIREKPFEYLFYVDILFTRNNDLKTILNLLKDKTEMLKLLGIYESSK